MFDKYEAEKVKKMLASVTHLAGSFESALGCFPKGRKVSAGYVMEMQTALDNEFARLQKGLLPSVVINHEKTRR